MLLEELHNKTSPYEAIEVIAMIGKEMKLAEDVAKALKSENPIVREAAALALAELGSEAFPYRDKLVEAANRDDDREVREVFEAVIKQLDQEKRLRDEHEAGQ